MWMEREWNKKNDLNEYINVLGKLSRNESFSSISEKKKAQYRCRGNI